MYTACKHFHYIIGGHEPPCPPAYGPGLGPTGLVWEREKLRHSVLTLIHVKLLTFAQKFSYKSKKSLEI